jgi:hypothetical protein
MEDLELIEAEKKSRRTPVLPTNDKAWVKISVVPLGLAW